jgi:hypothetical protein
MPSRQRRLLLPCRAREHNQQHLRDLLDTLMGMIEGEFCACDRAA